VSYAHLHGVKVYIALNTLIKESELPLLIETLGWLEDVGVDGIIIQDLGLWRLARSHFPALSLHASTQMSVHNAAGVNMLAGMGFKRVVLARELSLSEIGAIRRDTEIELEHFVHGALCFSISGQCLFSSFITGRSGNRGRCVQPCRRRYRYRDKTGYHFSTSDLGAIDHLPRLIEAGVTSFKIEGRMKSAEYVGRVVSAYRMVLDARSKDKQKVLGRAREQLELSFGRKYTSGFLTGRLPIEVAAPSMHGTIGHYIGPVAAVRGNRIFVKLEGRVHLGDRLKVLPKNDQSGAGLTVIAMEIGRKKVKTGLPGNTVTIETKAADKIRPGDTVYKVAAEQAFTTSESVARQKLAEMKPKLLSLALEISFGSEQLIVSGKVAGIKLEKSYNVEVVHAEEKPLTEATLSRIFAKTDNAPFSLKQLKTGALPPVFIPTRELNEIRRDFYRQLEAEVVRSQDMEFKRKQQVVMATLVPAAPCPPVAGRHITLTLGDIMDVGILDDPLIERVVIPLTPENVRNLPKLSRQIRGRLNEIAWDIPAIIFPGDWLQTKGAVRQLSDRGFAVFRLNNIGHFHLLDQSLPMELIAGSQLYSMNSETIRAWRELGIKQIVPPLENDRDNLGELMARRGDMEICLTIYGPVQLMTSRIPLRGVKDGSLFYPDQGSGFRFSYDHGLTTLNSIEDFSLLGHLDEEPVSACSKIHLDLSHCGPFSGKGRAILKALKEGRELDGTTTFNLYRGLS